MRTIRTVITMKKIRTITTVMSASWMIIIALTIFHELIQHIKRVIAMIVMVLLERRLR